MNEKNITENDRPPLATRIVEARKRTGMSQRDLAKQLGITQQVVASWEKKSEGIHSDTLKKLAEALEVSADELLGIETSHENLSPTGKLKSLLERMSHLSKRKQNKVIESIEAMLLLQENL
jgi:transcriptional regulator with XRE-family HTH domain